MENEDSNKKYDNTEEIKIEMKNMENEDSNKKYDNTEEIKIEIKNELKYCSEKHYHDIWWSVLYVSVLVGTIVVFSFGFTKYIENGIPKEYSEGQHYMDKFTDYAENKINSAVISKILAFFDFLDNDDDIEYFSILDHNLIIYSSCIIIPIIASTLYITLILL